jgi:hypothetical protein
VNVEQNNIVSESNSQMMIEQDIEVIQGILQQYGIDDAQINRDNLSLTEEGQGHKDSKLMRWTIQSNNFALLPYDERLTLWNQLNEVKYVVKKDEVFCCEHNHFTIVTGQNEVYHRTRLEMEMNYDKIFRPFINATDNKDVAELQAHLNEVNFVLKNNYYKNMKSINEEDAPFIEILISEVLKSEKVNQLEWDGKFSKKTIDIKAGESLVLFNFYDNGFWFISNITGVYLTYVNVDQAWHAIELKNENAQDLMEKNGGFIGSAVVKALTDSTIEIRQLSP